MPLNIDSAARWQLKEDWAISQQGQSERRVVSLWPPVNAFLGVQDESRRAEYLFRYTTLRNFLFRRVELAVTAESGVTTFDRQQWREVLSDTYFKTLFKSRNDSHEGYNPAQFYESGGRQLFGQVISSQLIFGSANIGSLFPPVYLNCTCRHQLSAPLIRENLPVMYMLLYEVERYNVLMDLFAIAAPKYKDAWPMLPDEKGACQALNPANADTWNKYGPDVSEAARAARKIVFPSSDPTSEPSWIGLEDRERAVQFVQSLRDFLVNHAESLRDVPHLHRLRMTPEQLSDQDMHTMTGARLHRTAVDLVAIWFFLVAKHTGRWPASLLPTLGYKVGALECERCHHKQTV